MQLKENVLLKNYTTFKIGGRARYFCIAKNQKEIINAIKKAKEFNLPFFILGGGSNLLVSDRGYKGLVIKVKSQKLKVKSISQKSKIIEVKAGTSLGQLVNLALKNNLTGLEWAVGIPGTLGGAIYGNAGWPSDKKNISAVIESVEVLDISGEPKIRKFNKSDCRFKYRDSIFKHPAGDASRPYGAGPAGDASRPYGADNKNLIILSAFLQLKKGDKIKIKKEIAEVIKKRRNKIPMEPSAGCIFKNQKLNIKNKKLLKTSPEFKKFNREKTIPAGFLIERCGLKGKRIGNAQISGRHANFIINLGNAKAKDVVKLIKMMKQKVKNKFNVKLEEEIQYVGF